MFQKLMKYLLEHFEVWSINFCYDVVAETRNFRNFGCPKNGFPVSKINLKFSMETFFRCFLWLLSMFKVYLTCFEFTLGLISAYKSSITPTHWQKLRNLQGSGLQTPKVPIFVVLWKLNVMFPIMKIIIKPWSEVALTF